MRQTLYLIALVSFILVGCAKIGPRPQVQVSVVLDFSTYADQGFLFTEEPYPGEFDGLGIVTVLAYPEIRYEQVKSKEGGGIFVEAQEKTTTKLVKRVHLDQLVEAVYLEASALGGDGIMNFRLDWEYSQTVVSGNVIRDLSHVTATGFVIRRAGGK